MMSLATQLSYFTGISCSVRAYHMQKASRHSCIFKQHNEAVFGIAPIHHPDCPALFRIFASCVSFCAMIVLKQSKTVASLASAAAFCLAAITFLWSILLNSLRFINAEEMRRNFLCVWGVFFFCNSFVGGTLSQEGGRGVELALTNRFYSNCVIFCFYVKKKSQDISTTPLF